MAKVKITGHASGSGVITVTAPNTSTDRTITLPDGTGTLLNSDGSGASLTSLPNQKVNSNLIINGDFAVSQRGSYTSATSVADGSYYLDRWAVAFGGVSATIQDMGYSAKVVATSTATGSLRHRQKFEEMAFLSGKTVTISCQMKSNDANSRINMYADGWQSTTATHTGGGAWETISITLTIPSGVTTELSAHFGIDGASSADVTVASGDYCEIKDCKMELGSVATPFQHRSYGEELALCQRYFQSSFPTGVAIGNGGNLSPTADGHGSLTAFNANSARSDLFHFSCEMRATPSVTLYSANSADTNSRWGRYTGNAWVSAGSNTPKPTSKYMHVEEETSGMSAGYSYLMRGMWTADAEL